MWVYELFVLPADTILETTEVVVVKDTGNLKVSGEYSFGTDGASLKINVFGDGWVSKVKVVDVSGVSGEVKRVEELQELNLTWETGNYGITGGILTRDFISGRAKGEGLEFYLSRSSILYLRRYSPTRRVNLVLVGNFVGPYVFSNAPTVRRSVRVFLNGRLLKADEYSILPEGNSLYLHTEFEDGDLLTVEYQNASLSPSHIVEGRINVGNLGVRLYHERPAAKVLNGCTVSEGGDYIMRGDTFLLVPGKGNLSCTFIPSDRGNYTFVGDKYVPSADGNYVILPPDTSPRSSFAEITLSPGFGNASIVGGRVGDSLSYGGVWDMGFGSELRFRTSGDVFKGKRPGAETYNGNVWGGKTYGEANFGISYSGEGLFLGWGVSLGIGNRVVPGYTLEGGYGPVFGRYERFPAKIHGNVGVKGGGGTVSYTFHWDTSTAYRGGKITWRWIEGDLRRYGDGFWGYSLKVGWEPSYLLYSLTPRGKSLIGNLNFFVGGTRISGKVSSSQGFTRQERFVYVGKGWGDYEKDTGGNFIPYPYGSYRKETLYFPTEEATYDLSLSLGRGSHGMNLSGKWGKRIERYNLSAHTSGETYHLILNVSGDLTSSYTYSERRAEGRVGKPFYVKGEVLIRRFGADSVYFASQEVGYSWRWVEVGVEGLKGRAWAVSPVLRTRGRLYGEGGYRVFFGEVGNEIRYKPPGPFVSLNLNLSRRVGDVVLQGTLTGGYDRLRKGFYTFSFGVSGSL